MWRGRRRWIRGDGSVEKVDKLLDVAFSCYEREPIFMQKMNVLIMSIRLVKETVSFVRGGLCRVVVYLVREK